MEGTSQFGGMSSQDNDTTLHTNDFEEIFGAGNVSTFSEKRHRRTASHSPKEQHLLYKLYQQPPTSPPDSSPQQEEVKQLEGNQS